MINYGYSFFEVYLNRWHLLISDFFQFYLSSLTTFAFYKNNG